jgi:ATP-binding cassette, subfamily C (CFTR/MRP), member 1
MFIADPLSAVDAHVGRKLVDQVILGLLREKTVVLVTQQLHVLPQMDSVCVIERETMAAQGTYDELLSKGLDFQLLMQENEDENKEEDDEVDAEVDGLEGGNVGKKLSSVVCPFDCYVFKRGLFS